MIMIQIERQLSYLGVWGKPAGSTLGLFMGIADIAMISPA